LEKNNEGVILLVVSKIIIMEEEVKKPEEKKPEAVIIYLKQLTPVERKGLEVLLYELNRSSVVNYDFVEGV